MTEEKNVIANLNELAQGDHELYVLMQKVLKKQASQNDILKFQTYIDKAADYTTKQCKAKSKIPNTKSIPLSFTYDINTVSDTLYKAFDGIPENAYLSRKFCNVPMNEYCSKQRIMAMMHLVNTMFMDHNAEIIQANNFNAVAIWTNPENPYDFPRTNDANFNKIFFDDIANFKSKLFPQGTKYYYLFIIGRDLNDTVTRGSVRAIFEHYKGRSDKDGHPLVLEAINAKARDVYEHLGFKTYMEFKYGENEVDENGEYDPNGNGFTGYLMIYLKDAEKKFNKV